MTQKVAATPTNCISILKQTRLESWAIGKTKVLIIHTILDRIPYAGPHYLLYL